MTLKGATRMHVDNPLLLEFIRAVHDPDPRICGRLRPFAYPANNRSLGMASVQNVASFALRSITGLIAKAVGSIWGIAPIRRSAPVASSCC
jgi:hypothetical protein